VRRFSAWDIGFYVVMVAILASVVHPGSKAAQAVQDLTDALAAVVGEATGYQQKGS